MKSILITGAAGNLGSALIDTFKKNNFEVVGIYHKKPVEAKQKGRFLQADLRNPDDTRKVMADLLKENSFDVAVFTTGGFSMNTVANTNIEEVKQMISLNFETVYTVLKPVFIQMLQKNNGRIFLISSQQGLNPEKGTNAVAYTLSKSLLFTLSKILNAEASEKNVKVEVIVPTIIDTPQNRKAMPNADTTKWLKPGDLANKILLKALNTEG